MAKHAPAGSAVDTISRITIRGFKSIRELNDFPLRRFNVLIGANGSGKSNFVEFLCLLHLIFEGGQSDLDAYVARRGRAGSMLYYGPRVTQAIEARTQLATDKPKIEFRLTLNWGAPDDLNQQSEVLTSEGGRSAHVVVSGGGPDSISNAALDNSMPLLLATQRHEVTLLRSTLRRVRAYHFHDTSERAAIRLTQDLDRDDGLMGDGSNLAAFLHLLKENEQTGYNRILSGVRIVAPFIRDLVVEPLATSDRYVMLRWKDSSGDIFGPHQLSDGTLRAIALCAALLQPEKTMPSIMIFDEPELGLHPSAVSLIADLLKEASTQRQVIVATQSPLLIRAYEPEDIVVVERTLSGDGHGESTFSRLDDQSLELWLEDYDLGELYEKNVTGGYPR